MSDAAVETLVLQAMRAAGENRLDWLALQEATGLRPAEAERVLFRMWREARILAVGFPQDTRFAEGMEVSG